MKQTIRESIDNVELYDLEGDIDSAIKKLVDIKEKHTNYSNIVLSLNYVYDEATGFEIYGERLETDKEYKKRLKKLERTKISDAKAKERAKERERILFEKLKAKYEP